MTQNAYRLHYTDDTGSGQTIASFKDSGGQELEKGQLRWRSRRPSALALWADGTVFGDLPIKAGDFNNGTEPQVFWQEETSSGVWTDRFRGYIPGQGNILPSGKFKFRVRGFLGWLQSKRITLDPGSNANLVSTDNVTVLQEVVDALNAKSSTQSYAVDAPAEADITGTYPSIDRYSLDETAGVAFRDLTHKYNWALMALPEQDGSNNWKLRYEPVGYGGTVETLRGAADAQSNENAMRVREWRKQDVEDVVNTVQVIGIGSDGSRIVSDVKTADANAENPSSVSDFGERFQRFQLDYVDSKSEADTVAQDIANRKSAAEEGGQVHQPGRFDSRVANDSFEVIDSTRGIDAVFTCVEQVNFYPENASDLNFTFETANEAPAEGTENLRAQRQRLAGQTSIDAGSQSLENSNTETVQDQYDADSQNNHPHDVENTTSQDGAPNFDINSITIDQDVTTQDGYTVMDSSNNQTPLVPSGDIAGVGHLARFQLENLDFGGFSGDGTRYQWRLTVDTTGDGSVDSVLRKGQFTQKSVSPLLSDELDDIDVIVPIPEIDDIGAQGNIIQLELALDDGDATGTYNITGAFECGVVPEHSHLVQFGNNAAQGNTADLTIIVNTSDSSAGDTSQLTVTGNVAQDLIDVLQSISKEDR